MIGRTRLLALTLTIGCASDPDVCQREYRQCMEAVEARCGLEDNLCTVQGDALCDAAYTDCQC